MSEEPVIEITLYLGHETDAIVPLLVLVDLAGDPSVAVSLVGVSSALQADRG